MVRDPLLRRTGLSPFGGGAHVATEDDDDPAQRRVFGRSVMADVDVMGPVGYLVVEFPGNKMTGEGLPILVDLVVRGVIRVLDLIFVMKDDDGSVRAAELRDFDGDGELDLAVFEGASSGLLSDEDIAQGGDVLEKGASGAVLIYENRWAAPFTAALRRGGAQLVAAGFIPQDDLLASLEATELATN